MSEVSKHTYLFAAHIGTVNDKHWLIFDRNRDAANTIFFSIISWCTAEEKKSMHLNQSMYLFDVKTSRSYHTQSFSSSFANQSKDNSISTKNVYTLTFRKKKYHTSLLYRFHNIQNTRDTHTHTRDGESDVNT